MSVHTQEYGLGGSFFEDELFSTDEENQEEEEEEGWEGDGWWCEARCGISTTQQHTGEMTDEAYESI